MNYFNDIKIPLLNDNIDDFFIDKDKSTQIFNDLNKEYIEIKKHEEINNKNNEKYNEIINYFNSIIRFIIRFN